MEQVGGRGRRAGKVLLLRLILRHEKRREEGDKSMREGGEEKRGKKKETSHVIRGNANGSMLRRPAGQDMKKRLDNPAQTCR